MPFLVWVVVLLDTILRRVFFPRVLLGLAFACPYLVFAASVSDQVAAATDDADQDGIGSTTQL